jgi:DNA-binding MarR family transcriptional regulator
MQPVRPAASASRPPAYIVCVVQATRQTGEEVLVALWRVIRRLKSSAANLGGDPAALHVVHMVKEHGPMRLTALAEVAMLDASTVSRHVQSLEAAGYLARTGDPGDRRATLIQITESGHALLRDALAARGRLLDAALAGWDPADREALARLLSRLAEDMA